MTAAIPTEPDAAVPAFAAAGRILRRMDRNAFFACYFLPTRKRHAVYAVAAFCGMIREAICTMEMPAGARGLREHPAVVSPVHLGAGSCGCGSECEQRLAMFRDRLGEIYAGTVQLPAVASRSDQQHAIEAVTRVVAEYRIPQQQFLDYAQGLAADQGVGRYATWASLEKHCYGTAGVVSLIISGVLGVTHSDAAGPAIALGDAIRLTTILCDLRNDLARGKLYLPIEDLVLHRVTEQDLLSAAGRQGLLGIPGGVASRLSELMKFEIARARELFSKAATGIPWLADAGSRVAVSAVTVGRAGLLEAIERANYDVFSRPMALTGAEKLRRLPAAWRLARRRGGEALPRGF